MTTEHFVRLTPSPDFSGTDREMLDLWDDIDAFGESVRRRPEDNEYAFYDGPPFANGRPHYGHLLASTTKDVVPRYWTMRGYRVERRWGWDTHGLPAEMNVQKQLGLNGPADILEYGVDRFNEACRALVSDTADEWDEIIRRMGRWVDMENDYSTMDTSFMESVWWVFNQIYQKGLVYQSVKVLPYSWGATTPLSNFEAGLDYRDVDDPSITVRVPVIAAHGPMAGDDHLYLWTTTPWTLPSNLGVAVGADVPYARVRTADGFAWVASELVASVFDDDAEVVATAPGSDLVGAQYRPVFDYFAEERERGAFRVITSPDVVTDEGTGLVHMAPAYGEADFYALRATGFDVLVDPVDAQGNFTEAVPDVAGMNIKDADTDLIRLLRENGSLVSEGRMVHSYPFCYRTGTPLMFKAVPTWFVEVSSMSQRLVELNDTIHWVPRSVGRARFGNWLAGARDWAISRNRFWGSCIPIWQCDVCDHEVCMGSIDDLERHAGERPDDLHKHIVDLITFDCTACGEGTMTRVPEVLDVWFDSGSMPYGQLHYPFENKERFESSFPAQFISEGLDQTRGWFYTLHVLSTALFDSTSFRNCVVSGMILAEDGRKMSKSLRNYPDPMDVINEFGADALRGYLLDSPLLRAEPIRFSSSGVRNVVRTVMLPLWHTASFFTTYAEADGITLADLAAAPPVDQRPEIDRWIISVLQSLVADVNRHMEDYELSAVVTPTLGFIDHLTNWYVRRSRRRFWKERTDDDTDKMAAFATLYEVLSVFIRVLAPVMPFVTEKLHQELVVALDPASVPSVHLSDFPLADTAVIDTDLEDSMTTVRSIIGLGHSLRKRQELRVRQPLRSATVISRDPKVERAVRDHVALLTEELNVRRIHVTGDEGELVSLTAKPDFRKLGPRLGQKMREVAEGIAGLDHTAVDSVVEGGTVEVAGETLGLSDLIIERKPNEGTIVEAAGSLAVACDIVLDEDLIADGLARDVVSRIQQLRRDADLDVSDRIELTWWSDDPTLIEAVGAHESRIAAETLATMTRSDTSPTDGVEVKVDGRTMAVALKMK